MKLKKNLIIALFPLIVNGQLIVVHDDQNSAYQLQINDKCVFKDQLFLGTYFTYPANQTFTGFWKLNELQNDIELKTNININQVASTKNFMLLNGTEPGLYSQPKLFLTNDGINIQEIPFQNISISEYKEIDEKIYFSGYNFGGYGNILSTDGTINGTKNYSQMSSSFNNLFGTQFVKFGGQIYFIGVNGNGKWALYKIVNDQIELVFDGIHKVIVNEDQMYLTYYTTSGWKLYYAKYENNQITWKDVKYRSDNSIFDSWSYFSELEFLNGKLVTSIALPYQNENLYEVTEDSLKLINFINNDFFISKIQFLGTINNKLIFQAVNISNNTPCLWVTDGTNDGTSILNSNIKIGINPGSSSYPAHSRKVLTYANRLIFVGNTPSTGLEIFYTDGSVDGTKKLIEVSVGPANSNPSDMIIYDDKLFFEGINSSGNVRIYKYKFNCISERIVKSIDVDFINSEKRIFSKQKIENKKIEYKTNLSILLEEGFEVKGNSSFTTFLQSGCVFE